MATISSQLLRPKPLGTMPDSFFFFLSHLTFNPSGNPCSVSKYIQNLATSHHCHCCHSGLSHYHVLPKIMQETCNWYPCTPAPFLSQSILSTIAIVVPLKLKIRSYNSSSQNHLIALYIVKSKMHSPCNSLPNLASTPQPPLPYHFYDFISYYSPPKSLCSCHLALLKHSRHEPVSGTLYYSLLYLKSSSFRYLHG